MQVWGKCDCIEAQRWEQGCKIKAVDFPVMLYPIEYKHGSVREERSYMIQLCAQAMCLEEMFSTNMPCSALFFITANRRIEVEFTDQLRSEVTERVAVLRNLWEAHIIPPSEYSAKCRRCSIQEYCMPKVDLLTKIEYRLRNHSFSPHFIRIYCRKDGLSHPLEV